MGQKKWKLKTPTNYGPELVQKWTDMYNDLINNQGYKKSAALEQIGIEHGGLSRATLYYWLFPEYKKSQKKLKCKTWSYEKKRPGIKDRITNYKRNYMHLRRHIDEFIEQAYACTPINGSLSIDEISRNIEYQSGIALSPETILKLNANYISKHGTSLLEKASGSNRPDFYRLKI